MAFVQQSYNHFEIRRIAFCFFFTAVLGLFVLSHNARAQEEAALVNQMEDPYLVENIEVDESADNAVEARSKAFEAAQIKGYRVLAERMLSQEELASFTDPDINTASRYVKNFEVTNEKLSATRYKGIYKIRYSPRAFAKMNPITRNENSTGAQPTRRQVADILILPFYEANGQTMLWQQNPFLNAWVSARQNSQSGRVIVPKGDSQDISLMNNGQALNYNADNLNNIRSRYRARDVVIMVAQPQAYNNGQTDINVSLYHAKPYGPELVRQFTVKGYVGEIQEQRYGRVVSTALSAINQQWRSLPQERPTNVATTQPPAPSGPLNSLTAQVNFNSAREWVEIKKALEATQGVNSVNVKSLSTRIATLSVNYQGNVESLRSTLQRAGIVLNAPNKISPDGSGGIYKIYKTQRNSNYTPSNKVYR